MNELLHPDRLTPPSGRQFVAVAFRPGDQRTYTYHNDGEPVAIGDRVIIPSRNGGEQVVTVSDIPPPCFVPKFETKAIKGKAPPADDAEPTETERKEA